ncbi:hypothetical protein EYF80_053382 [Liparis tanakae]|uniref:Uncharacterized protein n=1 Tax=Liparis tanakae TaxID=230148 RepID=A0A4Z2F833_9TELE|nr:hypothetical protein EYF80_053382 [Liparis tanakae]
MLTSASAASRSRCWALGFGSMAPPCRTRSRLRLGVLILSDNFVKNKNNKDLPGRSDEEEQEEEQQEEEQEEQQEEQE